MIKEMLILQYIYGNELPTLPYTVCFRNTLSIGSAILSLALPFAPGTLQAFYSTIYAGKIGGGNGLGIKTSDMRSGDLGTRLVGMFWTCTLQLFGRNCMVAFSAPTAFMYSCLL